jgi:hypothetical protein
MSNRTDENETELMDDDLARLNLVRAETRRQVEQTTAWDDPTRSLVFELLDLMAEILSLPATQGSTAEMRRTIRLHTPIWPALAKSPATYAAEAVAEATVQLISALPPTRLEAAAVEAIVPSALRMRLNLISRRANELLHLAQLDRAKADNAAATESLEVARDELKEVQEELSRVKAAGAEVELADHFRHLANNERKLSDSYRIVAFGFVALVVLVGFLSLFSGNLTGDRVADAVGHVIVALGLGGTSAYAGRLAGQHRVTADWAESVKIQLLTFETFLLPVTSDEVRNQIYQDFSRRVLGAPPSSSNPAAEPGLLPMSQVLDLLMKSSKPQPSQG